MILIFSEKITERLIYICHFILKEQLGLEYSITNNIDDCNTNDKAIINYSYYEFSGNVFTIKPHKLLFEDNIQTQETIVCNNGKCPSFFNINNSDTTFDVFAASFYLITRYEEYLPYHKDMYGRFAHENSIAFKNNFLDKPIVNIWIEEFAQKLQNKFSEIRYFKPVFNTTISFDIDMAWSFKNKGLFRNIGGFIKSPSLKRFAVLFGKSKDPFDCYEFLNECHRNHEINIIYFFLVAHKKGIYDKNISPSNKHFKKLIIEHAKKNDIGLHPSWRSYFFNNELINEKSILETISGKKIINSRQHYIKFSLPETYQQLISCGIQNDFSMGYGSINGFRASVASSFFWYNLQQECTTKLRIYPFCFMDANCHYEQKLSVEHSHKELQFYKEACKKVNGIFIPIFHNNFLGADPEFNGWKELYVSFLSEIS